MLHLLSDADFLVLETNMLADKTAEPGAWQHHVMLFSTCSCVAISGSHVNHFRIPELGNKQADCYLFCHLETFRNSPKKVIVTEIEVLAIVTAVVLMNNCAAAAFTPKV